MNKKFHVECNQVGGGVYRDSTLYKNESVHHCVVFTVHLLALLLATLWRKVISWYTVLVSWASDFGILLIFQNKLDLYGKCCALQMGNWQELWPPQ